MVGRTKEGMLEPYLVLELLWGHLPEMVEPGSESGWEHEEGMCLLEEGEGVS